MTTKDEFDEVETGLKTWVVTAAIGGIIWMVYIFATGNIPIIKLSPFEFMFSFLIAIYITPSFLTILIILIKMGIGN